MKKSVVTRELVNVFPPTSKVRTDEQSVGYQLLNTIAQPLERMEKQLIKMGTNEFLISANLDEIDILYKVTLPTSFTFQTNSIDPLFPTNIAPTVSGTIDGNTYTVTDTANNDLQSFWYEAVPDRLSVSNTIMNKSHEILNKFVYEMPQSGVFEHHLSGGNLWLETIGGTEYIKEEDGKLKRAKIVLQGKTRKGTLENETIIFPWDMKQKSSKEWKELYDVDTYDMESGVYVEIKSGNFNSPPYLSPWNIRFSDDRKKIDEFWDFGNVSGIHTLDRIEYVSNEWQQLVLGFSDTQPVESWELLDTTGTNVSGLDLALQPFTDNIWILSTDHLYCYDINEIMVSGISLLENKATGTDITIELEQKTVTYGEVIEFLPWHSRPLQEIIRYRIWYQTPSGTKYGLLNGTQVSFSSNFWIKGEQKTRRSIENYISIPADERGEYLIVFEAVFRDDSTQETRRLVPVNHEFALCEFDLSSLVAGTPIGLDFDSDQNLWIYTTSGYYEIEMHYDIMLIDYEQKKLYFRENYDSVEVV